MAHVVIIGGGFAGVWSAAGAALARGAADLRTTLIAPNEYLVLRPRLYEPEPDLAKVELSRILAPIGVEHLRASVRTIDTDRRVVTADGHEIGYDRLVLASGSSLVAPRDLPGAHRLFDIDTLDGARRLTEHLRDREDHTCVVVGAGFVGLEAATALAAGGRVVLVDRAEVVGDQLGPGPRKEIEAALDELGIECRLRTTVTEVGDGYVVLSDGTKLGADAVVWCAGIRASERPRQISDDLDHLGRVPGGPVGWRALPEVFVAGYTAAAPFDAGHTVMQACQHATPQGKVAGYNAVADLLGLPLRDFTPGPYVTCLDLGGAFPPFTLGLDPQGYALGRRRCGRQEADQPTHPPAGRRRREDPRRRRPRLHRAPLLPPRRGVNPRTSRERCDPSGGRSGDVVVRDRPPGGDKAAQEQLPHWQLWRDFGSLWASASLHHAHFDFPALVHAQPICLPPVGSVRTAKLSNGPLAGS